MNVLRRCAIIVELVKIVFVFRVPKGVIGVHLVGLTFRRHYIFDKFTWDLGFLFQGFHLQRIRRATYNFNLQMRMSSCVDECNFAIGLFGSVSSVKLSKYADCCQSRNCRTQKESRSEAAQHQLLRDDNPRGNYWRRFSVVDATTYTFAVLLSEFTKVRVIRLLPNNAVCLLSLFGIGAARFSPRNYSRTMSDADEMFACPHRTVDASELRSVILETQQTD